MTNLGSWLQGVSRRPGLAALFAGAAMVLAAGGFLPPAEASPISAKSDLQPGPAGGADVTGRVQFKHQRRGDRVKLQLRNLEPKTRYEVRDALTKSVLAGVRTNRLGKARASILSDRLPDGSAVGLAGLPIEVCVAGNADAVLEGQVPGDDEGSTDGCVPWTDLSYRTASLETDPSAAVQASLSLSSVSGKGLDTPLDSMSLFVGPGFPGDGMERPTADVPGPVTLWIADGDGNLQQVASIDADSYDGNDGGDSSTGGPDGGVPGANAPAGGRHQGRHHGAGMGSLIRSADGSANGSGDPTSAGGTGSYYFWYADNSTGGGLPLGAATVDELVGRSVEVRDGDGNVVLSGTLPVLQDVVFEDPFKNFTYEDGSIQTDQDAAVQVSIDMSSWSDGTPEGTYQSISLFVGTPWAWMMNAFGVGGDAAPIPGPVTFWIAGGEGGDLQQVASIDAVDWGGPGPMAGGGQAKFSFLLPGEGGGDGTMPQLPPFYAWSADNTSPDGLPLGVQSIKDLSGRAFEVRDGDGVVLFSGTLPELQEIALDPGPYVGDGTGANGGDPFNGMPMTTGGRK